MHRASIPFPQGPGQTRRAVTLQQAAAEPAGAAARRPRRPLNRTAISLRGDRRRRVGHELWAVVGFRRSAGPGAGRNVPVKRVETRAGARHTHAKLPLLGDGREKLLPPDGRSRTGVTATRDGAGDGRGFALVYAAQCALPSTSPVPRLVHRRRCCRDGSTGVLDRRRLQATESPCGNARARTTRDGRSVAQRRKKRIIYADARCARKLRPRPRRHTSGTTFLPRRPRRRRRKDDAW